MPARHASRCPPVHVTRLNAWVKSGLPCARPKCDHVDGRLCKGLLKLNSLLLSRLQPITRLDSPTLTAPYQALRPRPQVRRHYSLSLRISISGGKKTYRDSPNNGEQTGNNPALTSGVSIVRIVVWRSVLSSGSGPSPLEGGAGQGEIPIVTGPYRTTRLCLRVGLFGNAAQNGG